MFSFLRRNKIRQNYIQLTGYANDAPIFIARSHFDNVTQIYQSDIGTEKQRTHLCDGVDVLIVRETPEEIFRLLDR